MTGVRHLYVHLPFCTSRCGYCAFVVEVGALDRRDDYLDALLAELAAERGRIGRARHRLSGGRHADADGAAPHCAADGGDPPASGGGGGGDDRGQSRDRRPALRSRRCARRASRASRSEPSRFSRDLLRALDRQATPHQVRARVRRGPCRGVRQRQHRPAVRRARAGPADAAGRHRRGDRSGRRPRLVVRTRGQAG